MSSEPGLFGEVLARGRVRELAGDRTWLQAMLDVEAALARAQAEAGVIPAAHAAAIAGACEAEGFDLAELGRAAAEHGNPVLPLVNELRARVPAEVAASVHKSSTSQDILDTAGMVVARAALDEILSDVDSVVTAAAGLARAHRAVPMAGRTLMQRAEPVTFGFVAANWMAAVVDARIWVRRVRETRLAVQSGGAVGLLSGYPLMGLNLELPWHTNRVRVAEIACSLGGLCGVVAKVAGDVVLLASSEVAEVSEARPGGSSAMPHKRNPVASVSARACAAQAPGLVATLLAAMAQEHQRAAGMWHAEWRPLRELLIATGSAVSWLRTCLEGLRVHEEAMLVHLGGADASAAISAATLFVDRALERMVAS
ncbi:MAG TPA: lyase family protein [Candidatus Limnocylindrales bacterium]